MSERISGKRLRYPSDMIGRQQERERLAEFTHSGEAHPSLGVVWGRRRVGKSFLLESLVEEAGGFYYTAVRGSSAEALRELGARIGAYEGRSTPVALDRWDVAVGALLGLGSEREVPVVLDEYPYLLEHTPELDSVIQRALGTRGGRRGRIRTRLILCGSAMSVMGRLLSGTAALRGRAGLDLGVSPFDYRIARELHGIEDLRTSLRTYAVIGGVAAYARQMSAGDLPSGARDFDRWVCRRVLSPAAPLFNEVPYLLSEDTTTAKARKPNLYHAALAGAATGHHTHSGLSSYVKLPGASLAPIVEGLTAAQFLDRVQDPIRDNRPTYHPSDPLIRFHYAVIRNHQSRLARHGADTNRIWSSLRPTFDAQVVGPTFEALARYWAAHFATAEEIGGEADHVGPTTLMLADGTERQIDVLVAADGGRIPSERTVRGIGEAKAGERLGIGHVRRLEQARSAMGERAAEARLLLFGVRFAAELVRLAREREDIELIGLERLYGEA